MQYILTCPNGKKIDMSGYILKQMKGKITRDQVLENNQTHPTCLLYTSPSPRDRTRSRMPSSA